VAAAETLPVQPITRISAPKVSRLPTGSGELDRVLGGGIVPGSLVLLGGDPGIGKSTLLLQVAGRLAEGGQVLYLSGEESAEQLHLRAARLGVAAEQLLVATGTVTEQVIQTIQDHRPRLVVVDSIQTLATERFSSGPGSITQVRESAARLQTVAKSTGVPIVIVGHVTKEGQVAGPKVLEHLVDAVLYLEGDKWHGYRIIRGAKNRFGPTDEVGVFTMDETGLGDVANPTDVFVDGSSAGVAGTAVTASLEGTRALLVEVQALAVETSFGYPKRTASGFELNRLQLLIAVLSKHARVKLGSHDVYFNVSGGFRLTEPAGDLAAALAIAGAVQGKAVPPGTVAIGEIGLSGEVRPVSGLDKRLEEAARGGFKRVILSKRSRSGKRRSGLTLVPVATVAEALAATFGKSTKSGQPA
jgi:DNA repair protein RadA/Sms